MPAIVPKSYEQGRKEYEQLLSDLAAQWFEIACRNPYVRLYLWGERGQCSHGTSIWARVWVGGEDDNVGADAGNVFPVRPNALEVGWTEERMRENFRAILGREPLYVFAN
jgi:hypothetical protein